MNDHAKKDNLDWKLGGFGQFWHYYSCRTWITAAAAIKRRVSDCYQKWLKFISTQILVRRFSFCDKTNYCDKGKSLCYQLNLGPFLLKFNFLPFFKSVDGPFKKCPWNMSVKATALTTLHLLYWKNEFNFSLSKKVTQNLLEKGYVDVL